MTGAFLRASDAFAAWRGEVLSGKPPTLYPIGGGDLAGIGVGPGRVLLIGGAPAAGKTAFIGQATLDALRLTPDLKAVVCNVEMSPAVLLDRQLARLSGVPLNVIRSRKFEPIHAESLDRGFATLGAVMDRLAFVEPPYTLVNVAGVAETVGAGLIVLDYIQRIPTGLADHDTKRGAVDATMDAVRRIADCDRGVIVVSAVSRGRDSKGRASYSGLSLASFRESSELEFGADDAYILEPGELGTVTLRHLKARHSEAKDVALVFDGKLQRFSSMLPAGSNVNAGNANAASTNGSKHGG